MKKFTTYAKDKTSNEVIPINEQLNISLISINLLNKNKRYITRLGTSRDTCKYYETKQYFFI